MVIFDTAPCAMRLLFFYATYRQSPREKLLEFMAAWPQIEELKAMETNELALRYSEGPVHRRSQTVQPCGPRAPDSGSD
jgi:hypothetical protein